MDFQVIIPWGADGNLGAAYNQAMKTVDDWVCFIDHDVIHLNPNWYLMLGKSIERLGHAAGLITCRTNLVACSLQRHDDAPRKMDLFEHMRFAKQLYEKHGDSIKLVIPEKMPLPFSGFLMLTHKEAWEKAGGFKDGFLGVDNWYHEAVIEAGYKTYVQEGLYAYHLYTAKQLWGRV